MLRISWPSPERYSPSPMRWRSPWPPAVSPGIKVSVMRRAMAITGATDTIAVVCQDTHTSIVPAASGATASPALAPRVCTESA